MGEQYGNAVNLLIYKKISPLIQNLLPINILLMK